MRQPIRPFVTAYKNRSSKSRASQWYAGQPDANSPERSLIAPAADTPPVLEQDMSYADALAAADAVFGGNALEPIAGPPSPSGRILPCLLQYNEQSAAKGETLKKTSRTPRAPKLLAPKTGKTSAPPNKTTAAKKAVEPSPPPATPDIQSASSTRERSTIQTRWVRKTELKPGEQWKRRLCQAAR